jgi:hypothetical protein
MTGPLLAIALTATEILAPPWPLSPDGELVAVRGEGAPVAEGATIEPVPASSMYRVVPAPGASRVTIRAGGAEAVLPVEPPEGTIDIVLRTPAPVKGRDGSVELELAVRRADGEPDGDSPRPTISVSSGKVRDLGPAGPGRFRAVYELAQTRHPEVAVLVALVPRCPRCPTPRALGHAVVPLSAAVSLPGESDPGTRTTVRVSGRAFGPATADARGKFWIPVVIPPGARTAAATTVDALGNRKETTIDLRVPEVNRLACSAWPRALPADGRSEASIYCVASTDQGLAAQGAQLTLAASNGDATPPAPIASGSALQRATFRAPAGGGGGEAVLRATYPEGGAASHDEVRILLATGAPTRLVARIPREPVPRGATVAAETEVRDERGDLLGRPSGPPGATLGFVAPDRFIAATSGALQAAPLSFALPPGEEVATLGLRPGPRGWIAEARTVDARPAVGVEVRFGSGASARTDAKGEACSASAASTETAVARGLEGEGRGEGPFTSGVRAAAWAGIVPPAAPIEISRTVQVALRPPAPVDVVASLDGRAVRWRVEGDDGKPLPARRILLRSADVQLGPPERDGDGGRAAILRGHGLVAIQDAESGVAAVLEVP